MRLIGDIGGTNVRLAIVENEKITNIKKFLKKDFTNITEAIKHYMTSVDKYPNEAVIAVNTPVVDNKPFAGSNNWGYESSTLKQDTKLEKIIFLNDLVAHAMSLPYINDSEKHKVYGREEAPKGTIAIVGPGTGLGVAYGLFDEQSSCYNFIPSEGGSQLVSPADIKQIEILTKILAKQSFVRWEEMVSGKGIAYLYEALFNEKKTTEDIMYELSEGSKRAKETFTIICEFLGVLLRNIAATFLSDGGIYIIGGIFSRKENLEFLKKSKFADYYRFTFPQKATFMEDYPIYVITHPESAFVGLANYDIK